MQLLRRSRAHNEPAGITGVLLYGASQFLQVLEGPAEVVRPLYARIAADPRHSRFEKLADGPVARREFADWHMSFALVPGAYFQGLLGYLTPAQVLHAGAHATVQQVLREFLEAGAEHPLR